MKFRINCDIDLYFGNIFLQFWINIDFCQPQRTHIHFDRPPPPRTLHRPPVGGSAHVGNRWSRLLTGFQRVRHRPPVGDGRSNIFKFFCKIFVMNFGYLNEGTFEMSRGHQSNRETQVACPCSRLC